MSTLTAPYNIRSRAAALAEGLSFGDKIHLSVRGNYCTDDAVFLQFLGGEKGIAISVQGRRAELSWANITELWALEEKPNIYFSDIPGVAQILRQLKSDIRKCVERKDSAGVLFLLDEVIRMKKAERVLTQGC